MRRILLTPALLALVAFPSGCTGIRSDLASVVADREHRRTDEGTWASMVGTYAGSVKVPISGYTWAVQHKLILGGTALRPRARYFFGPSQEAKIVYVKSLAPNIVRLKFEFSEAELTFHGRSFSLHWVREDGSVGTGLLRRQ